MDPISPGTYDVTLRSEHGTAVANDSVTVTVDQRSTTDLTAYTTREVVPGDFGNATAIRDAIADGTLGAATTATANDTVVYAVNATGLTGLPAAANASLERGTDLDRLDGLSFGVTRTGTDDANASGDGDALGSIPNESTVHLDREGLFLVADGETAFGTETPPADGDTFEAGFRVDDDRLRRAGDGDRRVTARVTYAAADPVDERPTNETGDESAARSSTGAGPNDSGGPSRTGATGESGAPSGSGTPSSSGGSGGSGDVDSSNTTGGSTGTGGSADSGGPAGTSTGSSGESQGAPNGSRGPDGDPATAPLGVGITVAPGTSEILPSAGALETFGTDRTDEGTDGPSTQGSRPATERSSGDGASDADSEGATGPAESVGPSEASDSSSDGTDASDLGYDDAPIRSTAYDLPGFGPVGSLAAVACASLLARRRVREP
ncbi:PGF-CTERM sorting domain-containing protein [Halorubrum sp. BOL3-1]|uniref:PGF-CTERM sorting domain-containing protein n=1 Tax=Halorubrum sp. BOL3-1 TaxID=2497325 RepID=UPI001F4FEF3F|nr:PGF-CTERM sorting domain-containing protein [Halorubrum sp. BOL3-1]